MAQQDGEATVNRERLTRQRVLAGALALIDREGVEGLSMRRLGAEVGVEAMSLYNHVTGKEDVLDGVVGLLWREIEARTRGGGSWQDQARAVATAVRETAHAHPHAYPLVLRRSVLPSELLEVAGQLLAALREAGFGELAGQAMVAIGSHAASQALAELAWFGDGVEQTPSPEGPSQAATPAGEAGQALAACNPEAQFAFSLQLLLDGLAARLAAPDPVTG